MGESTAEEMPFCGSLKPPKCAGSPMQSGSKFSREIDAQLLSFFYFVRSSDYGK